MAYQRLGGAAGILGAPTSDAVLTPVRDGERMTFQGGALYLNPALGKAFRVSTETDKAYLAAAGEVDAYNNPVLNVMGLPISDEQKLDNRSYRAKFNGGSFYHTKLSEAFALYGAFDNEYSSEVSPGVKVGSRLGMPLSAELSDGLNGRVMHFENGDIYRISSNPTAFALWGPTNEHYKAMNGTRSYLGYPITRVLELSGGQAADFVHGTIVWHPGIGTKDSAVSASLSHGVLYIHGSARNDNIHIINEQGYVIVDSATIRVIPEAASTPQTTNISIPSAWVSKIEIDARAGFRHNLHDRRPQL